MFAILHSCFATYLNLFFLLTPFFVLSSFISITDGIPQNLRAKLAFRIAFGATVITLLIYLAGTYVMQLFDITVDAFRAGSGVLLLLTAVNLVLDKKVKAEAFAPEVLMDMAVVPLATPITAGPACLGALMVMGNTADGVQEKAITSIAIVLACASIWGLLVAADKIEKLLGHANISVLSKITGLILSAISLQMIVTGVKNLWLM